MSIKGQIYLVNDAAAFFPPVVAGGKPSTGFTPAKGMAFVVTIHGLLLDLFVVTASATASTANGTFELPDLPGAFAVSTVWVTVTLTGAPYYRSTTFPLANTKSGLNIYIYQPTLPRSAGVTAGSISKNMGSGLPGNTKITATPWGLNLSGSKSEANIKFGILITPDTSPNLGVFLDLALNGWNIHVGWPEDWCESATDILNSIRSGLQNASSSVNQSIEKQIVTTLEGPPFNQTQVVAQAFVNAVSTQFVSLTFDNNYSWPLSNHTDSTIVLRPVVAFGYPRSW